MREIIFRVWHYGEKKMYFRGYQKVFHVLLCDDDRGVNQGKGKPVKRASYDECEFMEGTGILDVKEKEIFEGDIIKGRVGKKTFEGPVEGVPDMFKSRGLHPLHYLFEKFDIPDQVKDLEVEILGNIYER